MDIETNLRSSNCWYWFVDFCKLHNFMTKFYSFAICETMPKRTQMISTESLISACEVGQRDPYTYSSVLLWLIFSEPDDKNPLPSLTTFFFHPMEPVFICLPVWNNVFFTGPSFQEILQIFYPMVKTRYKTLFSLL